MPSRTHRSLEVIRSIRARGDGRCEPDGLELARGIFFPFTIPASPNTSTRIRIYTGPMDAPFAAPQIP